MGRNRSMRCEDKGGDGVVCYVGDRCNFQSEPIRFMHFNVVRNNG